MNWFAEKLEKLHIITESEIEDYQLRGFVVKRLDPSVTGNWVFAPKPKAIQYLEDKMQWAGKQQDWYERKLNEIKNGDKVKDI